MFTTPSTSRKVGLVEKTRETNSNGSAAGTAAAERSPVNNRHGPRSGICISGAGRISI